MMKHTWKFSVRRTSSLGTSSIIESDYAIGETEQDAISDLVRKRRCESAGFDSLREDTGTWILVCADGTDLEVSRGRKLA